jgi:hypothetical protein
MAQRGLLAVYQVLRMAMADAAQTGGLDPDRASFTIALEAARDSLSNATGILPITGNDGRIDLTGAIGRAVLAHPLPARRARYSARKVKSPISHYHARPADDDRPLVTTSIDTVTTEIQEPVAAQRVCEESTATAPAAPTPAGRGRPTPQRRTPQPPAPPSATATASSTDTTGASDPPRRPAPTTQEILDLLRSDPHRPWHGRDVAQILNVTNINSLCTRMSQWAHKGLLHKIGRTTYTLTPAT